MNSEIDTEVLAHQVAARPDDQILRSEYYRAVLMQLDGLLSGFPPVGAPLEERNRARGDIIGRLSALPEDMAAQAIEKAAALGVATKTELKKRVKALRPAEAAVVADEEPLPPGFSEDALAQAFTERHGAAWRYVAGWGKWLQWDGARWRPEETLRVFDLARDVCREVAQKSSDKRRHRVRSAAVVAAVERFARADRTHAAKASAFDADPLALNTPGGVVNLRDGKMLPHEATRHMTKLAGATPSGECPAWRAFLRRATDGDEGLERYLARVAGYALTGVTTEHALFFIYGTGANGKSVFLNTLAAVMGEYATTAPADTFLEMRGERHPTELAALRGARLVTALEVERGRRWAEARIKALTGGDRIAARYMRQDFFEFTPVFKLIMAGNHKPGLRDVDEAIRRRLHLIPFSVTVPKEERDQNLTAILLTERDGILKWALEGCLEWQISGLDAPQSVVSATEEYLEAEDSLGIWLEEACTTGERCKATTAELFEAWKAWAEKRGEAPGTAKRLADDLAKRGFAKWRSRESRGFRGLALGCNTGQGELSGVTDGDGR